MSDLARLVIAVGGIGLCLARLAVAQNRVSKDEFLARYEPAAKRLEEFYSNVEMRAVSTSAEWPAYNDTGGRRSTRVVFRANGDLMRVDATIVSEDDSLAKGRTSVRVANPKGSFLAGRGAGKADFVLLGMDPDYGASVQTIRATHLAVAAPFAWLGAPIADTIRSDAAITLTRIEETSQDGEPVVKVFWEDQRAVGWFLFLKDRSWALREYSFWAKDLTPEKLRTQPDRYFVSRAAIEYGDTHDGIPLLKTAKYWRETGPARQPRLVETIVVEELVAGPVPEREFTLAALGIPSAEQTSNTVRPALLFVLGTTALILAYLVLRRSLRLRRQ